MSKECRAIVLLALFGLVFGMIGCYGGTGGFDWVSPTPTYIYPSGFYPSSTPSSTPSGTGSVQGYISVAGSDGSAQPAGYAFVSVIDQGIYTYADANGNYSLTGVIAGERLLYYTYGTSRATSVVNVVSGEVATVNIELPATGYYPTPTPTSSSDDTGTIRVVTYGFYEDGKWVGVKYIRVWEQNNYSNRWYDDWSETGTEGQSSFELYCNDAAKGKWYNIEVGWHNGDVQTGAYVHLTSDNETKWIYHSY